jgi:magnesium chelatase family protein
VLFLDEMLEFSRHVLEVLRQPLEERSVTISRAARTAVFPARFMLVGAMNPCPCGYLGDALRECRCTPQAVGRYREKLSGPLRDRLDLSVEVPALPPDALIADATGEPSSCVRARVIAAREIQQARFEGDAVRSNTDLTPQLITRYCSLDRPAMRVLNDAVRRLSLSARAYDRVRKVARTIADLEGVGSISPDHLAEALQFRLL